MFDGDADGVLDSVDMEKIVSKLLEIGFSLVYLIIATVKRVGLAVTLPAVNIALSLKPMVAPGSTTDSITTADLELALSMMGGGDER